MTTWIAFLRGVNVGGKGLPMAELTTILEGLGCSAVQTYVQSGNAIFGHAKATASELAVRIGAAIDKRRGFRPKVLVLRVEELAKAVAANPFRDAEGVPTSIHLFFLAAKPAGEIGRAHV